MGIEIFQTDIATHLDARDIECDYDTDSDGSKMV